MTADRRNYIKTPWNVRIRRLMQGWPLQGLTFVALAVLVAYLWQGQTQVPNSVGQAGATRVNVTTSATGKLLPMYELDDGQWNQFDTVYKGQVVARLDDSALRAELAAFQQETESLRSQLADAEFKIAVDQAELSHEHWEQAINLAREVERYRLDILDRLSQLEQDRLELGHLETQVKLAQQASSSGMLNPASLRELETQRDTQAKLVSTRSAAYREAQEGHRAALQRIKSQPAMHELAVEQVLSPLRASISAAEARVEHMHAQLAALEIRSPIDGTITAVHCYPGQGIRAGEWILTIAANEADHIVAYVRANQSLRPVEGSPVGVRLRMPSSTLVMATAQQVGSQWEPLPEELRTDPNMPEMVLPVRVSIPTELDVLPGELVDITFFRDRREGI